MSYAWKPKVETLIEKGSYGEAATMLQKLEIQSDLEKLESLLELSLVYEKMGDKKKLAKTAEQCLKLSKKLRNTYHVIEALIRMIYAALAVGDLKSMKNHITDAFELIDPNSEDLKQSLSELYYLKGIAETLSNHYTEALEAFDESEILRSQLQHSSLLSHVYNAKAILYEIMGETKKAKDYHLKSLELKEKYGEPIAYGRSLNNYGNLLLAIGEVIEGKKFLVKAYEIFVKSDSKNQAQTLHNLGRIAIAQNDYASALEYTNKAIGFLDKHLDSSSLLSCLFTLYSIKVHLEHSTGDVERQIEDIIAIHSVEREGYWIQKHLFEAYKKFLSRRKMIRFQALEHIEPILESEDATPEIKLEAILMKSSILMLELSSFNNLEALNDLEELSHKLEQMSEEQNSPFLFVNSLLLRAKTNVFLGKLDLATQNYSDALALTEQKGMYQMGKTISEEYERDMKYLFNQRLIDEFAFPETATLGSIQSYASGLISPSSQSTISKEIPVMVVIIDMAGIAKYSKVLDNQLNLDMDLIASFISAIQSFVKEAFKYGEGLKQLMNQNFGLVFGEVEGSYVAYMFTGDSYFPLLKINKFTKALQETMVPSALKFRMGLKEKHVREVDELVLQTFLQ